MGANLSMLQLMIELKKIGHSPCLLIPNEGIITEELRMNEIDYITSKYFMSLCDTSSLFSWIKGLIRVIINPLFYIYAYFKTKKHCGSFDVIHSNTSVIHIGEFFSLLSGAKHIKHLREFGSIDYNLKYALGTHLQKKINDWFVDKNIAISDSIYKHYNKLGFKNIITIYNGISPNRIYKSDICEKRDYTNIICMGVISENKNQKQLIDAVISIVEKSQKIYLYLLGEDKNPYAESLKEYVKQKNAKKYIHFCGFKKDVSNEILSADIAVVPSLNEAFGRVTVEYMFNHIPVIVSNQGANIELIKDYITGLIYDLDNTSSLIKCIEILHEDYSLRRKLSDLAYCEASSKYTSEINAQCISKIYNN